MYFFFVEYYKYLGSKSFITESFLSIRLAFYKCTVIKYFIIIINLQK